MFSGGAFEGVEDQVSPFGYGRGEGVDAGHGDPEWICNKEKPQYEKIFQSLNPIDGKVTGAGTTLDIQPHTPAFNTHPELEGIVVVDKALQALLSSTQNCHLLTELCMSLNKEDNEDDDSFNKALDTLTIATQNSHMISRFLNNLSNAREYDDTRLSCAVSIHSLNESMALEGPSASAHDSVDDNSSTKDVHDHEFTEPSPKASEVQVNKNDNIDTDKNNEFGNEANVNKDVNLNVIKEEGAFSFFRPVFDTIKFITLLGLNIIVIFITAEIIFISMVHVITGKSYIEFYTERTPNTLSEKIKSVAFGPESEFVRINSMLELFYKQNFVNILKYFLQSLSRNSPL